MRSLLLAFSFSLREADAAAELAARQAITALSARHYA